MNRIAFLCLLASCLGARAEEWKIAEPGWRYEFPRDHHVHRDFKTEWWYFTGNLTDSHGQRFGYELTFFRHGIRPAAQRDPAASRFIVDDLKFAHFTVTDVSGRRFCFDQKMRRGAFGEAGFDREDKLAWIENWTLRQNSDGSFDVAAETAEAAVKLHLVSAKPPVIHGTDGISRKAAGEGHASCYYSLTRLTSTGELRVGSENSRVEGESWFDHEWATNQLAANQAGWDWLCLQWDDGSELMLYRMRLTNGEMDPASSGTYVAADGATTHLVGAALTMKPTKMWQSTATGARYPVGWHVELPEQRLAFDIRPVLDNQELAMNPLTYWEGAIDATGSRDGKALNGRGYLELTGYAGPLNELSR